MSDNNNEQQGPKNGVATLTPSMSSPHLSQSSVFAALLQNPVFTPGSAASFGFSTPSKESGDEEGGPSPSSPPAAPPVVTMVSQDIMRPEIGMDIKGAIEDQLFHMDQLPTAMEFLQMVADNPISSNLATTSVTSQLLQRSHFRQRLAFFPAKKSQLEGDYKNCHQEKSDMAKQLVEAQKHSSQLKQALQTAETSVEDLSTRVQDCHLEQMRLKAAAKQAERDQDITIMLHESMTYVMSLHASEVARQGLPFAATTVDNVGELPTLFALSDYESTDVSQRRHIAVMRSLKYLGYHYSPFFYQLSIIIVANKDISKDVLRVQTCRCLGIKIPDLSKKRKGSSVSSKKKKSTKNNHDEGDAQQMAAILSSPLVQAAIASAVENAMSPRAHAP
jgi:hypothetical protein